MKPPDLSKILPSASRSGASMLFATQNSDGAAGSDFAFRDWTSLAATSLPYLATINSNVNLSALPTERN
jgi:hypothetical protein